MKKPIRRMTSAAAIVASLRMERSLFTFAITENLQNVNNTPDIGFQLGLAYIPQRAAAWR